MDNSFGSINIIVSLVLAVLGGVGWFLWRKFKPAKQDNQTVEPKGTVPSKDKENGGKYKAYIWDGKKITTSIKIPEPVGNIWAAEPSLKVSGGVYFVQKVEAGYAPIDARNIPIEVGNTAQDLFEAIHDWEKDVGNVYIDPLTLWDQLKLLAPYLILGGLILALIVLVDKIF